MPKKPRKSWEVWITCKCGKRVKSALVPGNNDITGICQCNEELSRKWRVQGVVVVTGLGVMLHCAVLENCTITQEKTT